MSLTIDVLGQEVSVPDPDAIESLAGHYRAVGGQIGSVRDDLRGVDRDTTWTGAAADAFRKDLGELPGELDKACTSYGEIAATMSWYGSAVREWLGGFRGTTQQANDVSHELRLTEASIEQASAAGTSTSALQARADSLRGELDQLQGRLAALSGDDLPALARGCVDGIRRAQDAGIKDSFLGWTDQYVVHDVLGTVATLADDLIVKPFADLPGDLAELAEHPSWAHLGEVLGDVAGIVAIAGMAFGLTEFLIPAMLALDVARTGTDAVAAAEGEGSWLTVATDGVSLATDGVGGIAGRGAGEGDAAIGGLRGQGSRLLSTAGHVRYAGGDATDLYREGFGEFRAARAVRASQTFGSLFKTGGLDVLKFDRSALTADLHDFNPIRDLLDNFRTTGAQAYSSEASVLLHRISYGADKLSTGIEIADATKLFPWDRQEAAQ